MAEKTEDLFEAHWEKYTRPLIDEMLNLTKFLCRAHWVHGAKHALEDKDGGSDRDTE